MLWGNCSTADHGVNLLLHALVTLLYAHTLLHALRLTPLQVLLSGLTFATHPVHTEAVGSDGRPGEGGVLNVDLETLPPFDYFLQRITRFHIPNHSASSYLMPIAFIYVLIMSVNLLSGLPPPLPS